MKPYKNENSFKNPSNSNKTISGNISLFNLRLTHKVFDTINICLLMFIFVLSFLSFDSQRKWTNMYKNLVKIRANNHHLIDYISKTEEFYVYEIESLNTLKKTTPKDLIYIVRQNTKQKKNQSNQQLKYIHDGLKNSKYFRGY